MSHLSLSIVTLTKNRVFQLRLCLLSLQHQLTKDDEILLLDNGSTDDTRGCVKIMQKYLPIRYYYSNKSGYPALYNEAVKKCKKQIIVFLDDDCIAGPSFVKNIVKIHKKITSPCIIQGRTISLPKHNIYAEIMGDHYHNWIKLNTLQGHLMRTFDNKNASMSRSLFLETGGYDETLELGAEDIEYGLRLQRKGVPIFYNPSIVAYHHERDNLRGFIKQHLRIAKGEASLDSRLAAPQRTGLITVSKIRLYVSSAWNREIKNVLSGHVKETAILPLLYISLVCLRLYGYGSTRLSALFANNKYEN